MIPALTIDELQRQAQRRLPKPIYDFIDGAAYDEATKVANRQAFLSLRLRQRVLRDIAVRDHGTTILGQNSSMPAMSSPVVMSGLFFLRKAQPGTTLAAKATGIRFGMSRLCLLTLNLGEARVGDMWCMWVEDRGVEG